MKRYRFRLAAVLRLRRAEQEQARIALAAANAELRSLLLARDQEARRYGQLARRPGAVDAAGLAAERSDAELAAASLRACEDRAAEAATRAAIAQVAWLEAHRRVLALERLEQRRREEHEADVRREEVALVDDLVNARYRALGPAAAGSGALE